MIFVSFPDSCLIDNAVITHYSDKLFLKWEVMLNKTKKYLLRGHCFTGEFI